MILCAAYSGSITETANLPALQLASGVTMTIDGGGYTLDGANAYGGLFVNTGSVTVENLTLAHAVAQGGNGTDGGIGSAGGGDGGGGGGGLGGGLFIGAAGSVVISGVDFSNDMAVGGNGGGGGASSYSGLGNNGGGGGLSGASGDSGGVLNSQSGGFGGGGSGGQSVGFGGPGGFGGGGYTAESPGAGGFGGGTGATGVPGASGFGGAGGGLGAGGDIFVQQGGSLTIEGGTLGLGTVTGGTGASAGSAYGTGVFLEGGTLTLAPLAGQTLTIDGAVTEAPGLVTTTTTGAGGPASLTVAGAGTEALNGSDSYTGGTNLDSGTLVLGSASAASSSILTSQGANAGNINFLDGSGTRTLAFAHGNAPSGVINGFGAGDRIDVTGVTGSVSTNASQLLTVGTEQASIALQFDQGTTTPQTFSATPDGTGGTFISFALPTPMVTEALAQDTGSSASDNVTSNPMLSGTADANATVTLTEGSTVLGTTTADGSGGWSFTPTGLADGAHTIVASETNASSQTGTASLSFTLETMAPAPTGLTLAPASDSGRQGDDITNVATPQITGHGVAGDTVTLYDGTTVVGTTTVLGDGTWAITASSLSDGSHTLTSTQTDVAGNVSVASGALTLTIDTAAPALSAGLASNPHNSGAITYNQLFAGGGDAGASVAVSDNGTIIGTVVADATGAWSFDLAALAPGSHSLIASETNIAGNTGVSSATPLTVAASVQPDTRFSLNAASTAESGQFFGSDYTGSVGVLKAQYGYDGTNAVAVVANVADTFMYGSTAGQTAIVAKAGSNVLAARGGSNWLVGASGADGGDDTFFVNAPSSATTWQTVLNFHVGDMLTVWDFNGVAGHSSLVDGWGQPGYTGTTLKVDPGNGNGALGLVTFAGLSSGNARLSLSTGSAGGHAYLAVIRTA